jgi:hypothetical protein
VQVTHTWVATFGAMAEVTFWESLTGARWQHPIERAATSSRGTAKHPYATIGCIFNHKTFLANVQPGDFLTDCSLDLRSPRDWKAMSRDALQSAGPSSPALPISLLPNTVNTISMADRLESELRAQITQCDNLRLLLLLLLLFYFFRPLHFLSCDIVFGITFVKSGRPPPRVSAATSVISHAHSW